MVLVRVALSVRRRLHRLPLFRHVIPLRRMSLQDACSILEVELNADRKAVKEAYFEKAKTYHPDNQVTGDAQMFRQVRKAYNLLQHGVPDGAARAQSQWRGNFDEEQQRRRRSQFEQFRRRQYEEARRAQEQKEDFEKLLRHFWRSMRNILSRQRKNFASLWEGEFKWATMAVGIFSVPLFFIALYGNRESLSDTMGRAAARKNITQREPGFANRTQKWKIRPKVKAHFPFANPVSSSSTKRARSSSPKFPPAATTRHIRPSSPTIERTFCRRERHHLASSKRAT